MTDAPENQPARTIVRLEIDSYKRLRAARVTPSPAGLIPVRGRNAAGKSSLIGAMLDALGAEKTELPITEGQHAAEVVVDLGDLVVRKFWSRDSGGKAKPALTIEAADGSSVKGPAGVLKELRGRFADPVAFLGMKPDEQVKTVLGVLGLDQELARLEEIAEGHYARRRDLGREADRIGKAADELEAKFNALPATPPTPGADDGEPADTLGSLAVELQEAKDTNAARDTYLATMAATKARGEEAAARLTRLREEVAKLEQEVEAQREAWTEAATLAKAAPVVEIEPIVARMQACEAAAAVAAERELATRTRGEAIEAKDAHAAAERALQETRASIAELLGGATFPIEGMAYDPAAKALTINGIPFSQASQAERLKASAAVAMAGNPSIRVLFARDGSLLDEESRLQLAELAEASGFQLWLEVVESPPDKCAICGKSAMAHPQELADPNDHLFERAPLPFGVWIEDGEAHQAEPE